jgi:hypothetical protein
MASPTPAAADAAAPSAATAVLTTYENINRGYNGSQQSIQTRREMGTETVPACSHS